MKAAGLQGTLYSLPGVQFEHRSVPSMEGLENVPSEHGKNEVSLQLLCVILNPEALRIEIRNLALWIKGKRIASVLESTGFLVDNKSLV